LVSLGSSIVAADIDTTVAAIGRATGKLIATITAMDGRAAAEPSLLPGWTRGHVLSHLARNADAYTGLLAGAVIGVRIPSYPTPAHRTAGITAGATRPLPEQLADVEASAARFGAAVAAMEASSWRVPVPLVDGRDVPARWVLSSRLREVEVHHVDLGCGYTDRNWPDGFVRHLLAEVTTDLGERLTTPVRLVAVDLEAEYHIGATAGSARIPPVVSGRGHALAGWLIGRPGRDRLHVTPDGPLPHVPAWR
jgi:maleylpyruvate isomerase